MIIKNQQLALDMVKGIENLLGYSLKQDAAHTNTLGSEVDIVKDYLAIQKLRHGDLLRRTLGYSRFAIVLPSHTDEPADTG